MVSGSDCGFLINQSSEQNSALTSVPLFLPSQPALSLCPSRRLSCPGKKSSTCYSVVIYVAVWTDGNRPSATVLGLSSKLNRSVTPLEKLQCFRRLRFEIVADGQRDSNLEHFGGVLPSSVPSPPKSQIPCTRVRLLGYNNKNVTAVTHLLFSSGRSFFGNQSAEPSQSAHTDWPLAISRTRATIEAAVPE